MDAVFSELRYILDRNSFAILWAMNLFVAIFVGGLAHAFTMWVTNLPFVLFNFPFLDPRLAVLFAGPLSFGSYLAIKGVSAERAAESAIFLLALYAILEGPGDFTIWPKVIALVVTWVLLAALPSFVRTSLDAEKESLHPRRQQ